MPKKLKNSEDSIEEIVLPEELMEEYEEPVFESEPVEIILDELPLVEEPIVMDVPIGEPPGLPTGLHALPFRRGINLSWHSVEGATGYNVYEGSVVVFTKNTKYKFPNLNSNTQYNYRVTAVNEFGESSSALTSAIPSRY